MISLIFLVLFFVLLLTHSGLAVQYAAEGLLSWFHHMIPALFPCIVWSNMMLETNSTAVFTKWLQPILRRLFGLSEQGAFLCLVGFTGGFPLGAKLTADLLKKGRISYREAEFLLSFCNNLGPVYLLGFLFPALHVSRPFLCLALFYGVPLLYGLANYNLVYHAVPFDRPKAYGIPDEKQNISLSDAMDTALQGGIQSIVMLGAYMIFFHTCRLFYLHVPKHMGALLTLFTEMTSGIGCLESLGILQSSRIPVFGGAAFGGLCCLAQTDHVLRGSGLSVRQYILHKILQGFIVFCVFYVCQNTLHIAL